MTKRLKAIGAQLCPGWPARNLFAVSNPSARNATATGTSNTIQGANPISRLEPALPWIVGLVGRLAGCALSCRLAGCLLAWLLGSAWLATFPLCLLEANGGGEVRRRRGPQGLKPRIARDTTDQIGTHDSDPKRKRRGTRRRTPALRFNSRACGFSRKLVIQLAYTHVWGTQCFLQLRVPTASRKQRGFAPSWLLKFAPRLPWEYRSFCLFGLP